MDINKHALGIVLLLLPGSALAATPSEGDPGKGFDVTGYELALTPDIANKTLVGRETIELKVTEDGVSRLSFSPNALTIDSAKLNGSAVTVTSRSEALNFDLPRPLARWRTVRLELTYRGKPARGFVTTPVSLYTSYFACDWMVCAQNQFGDKARFVIDLSVPAGMETLSVGSRVSRRAGPNGSEIHRWKAPRPYSAYLFGFAVGRFARAGSAQLSFLSDAANGAELDRRFADTKMTAAFLAEKAGVPLPVATYTQLLVPGDEAQEAATYSVLGIDALPKESNDAEQDWAIVHELAHQWWGNLITCRTLQHFWLNEGIATFMTAAWKEHRYGRAAYDAELSQARETVTRVRAAGYDKPLAWNGQYPKLGMRRAVQYSKGALFMDELRRTLGEDAFWSGLRYYTRAHAGGTVVSSDLQQAMEKASGRDLNALFTQWVYGDDRS